jgi:hypothetical protein
LKPETTDNNRNCHLSENNRFLPITFRDDKHFIKPLLAIGGEDGRSWNLIGRQSTKEIFAVHLSDKGIVVFTARSRAKPDVATERHLTRGITTGSVPVPAKVVFSPETGR